MSNPFLFVFFFSFPKLFDTISFYFRSLFCSLFQFFLSFNGFSGRLISKCITFISYILSFFIVWNFFRQLIDWSKYLVTLVIEMIPIVLLFGCYFFFCCCGYCLLLYINNCGYYVIITYCFSFR